MRVFMACAILLLGLSMTLIMTYSVGERRFISVDKAAQQAARGGKGRLHQRPKIRLKGELDVSIIRLRGQGQKELKGEEAVLRPGDSFRFKVTSVELVTLSLGFWSAEDEWTPVVENLVLEAGEHLLDNTFKVKSWDDIGGWVIYGLADDVAAAVSDADWENVNVIEFMKDTAVGSKTWDGFNVQKDLVAKFGFLSEEPADPITLYDQPELALGNHVCPWNHDVYWHSNMDQGGGMSWGDFEPDIGWTLESEGDLESGALVYLKRHCEGDECEEELPPYLLSNSGLHGGAQWGAEKEPAMGWRIEFEGALMSGTKVGFKANCFKESPNSACAQVAGLFLQSNAAEGAGQAWGPHGGSYAWILEYAGDPTELPTAETPVYLKGHCTGARSQWLPPDAAENESGQLSKLTPAEFWDIHADNGLVSGTPEDVSVPGPSGYRGALGRLGLKKYFWPIDGAHGVVQANIDNCRTQPKPSLKKHLAKAYSKSSLKERVKKHVVEGAPVNAWLLGNVIEKTQGGGVRGRQMTAGDNHSCRVLANGRVDCWGDNSKGQLNVPAAYYKAVSAGANHTCGLRVQGTAICWGAGDKGQTAALSGRFKSLSSNGDTTCALDFDGQAHCWGDFAGPVPTTQLASLSVGGSHACGVDYAHKVTCWGSNSVGQTEVPDVEFDQIGCADGVSCAIASADGAAHCWGGGSMLLPLDQNTGNMAIATHKDSVCLINRWHDPTFDTYNPIFCWGKGAALNKHPLNLFGTNDSGGEVLGMGANHQCGLDISGRTYCWGTNALHQTDHPAMIDFFGIGAEHICATDNGRVQCKGDNTLGQLYPPPPADRLMQPTVGDNHTCAVSLAIGESFAEIRCWGDGSLGQVAAPATPESLKGGPGTKRVVMSAGANHTCAMFTNTQPNPAADKLHCWGDGTLGQTQAPAGTYSHVASGSNHSCAINKETHQLVCWGDSSKGQTKAPLGSFRNVFAGGDVSCAVGMKNEFASLVCWGDTSQGVVAPPEKLEGVPTDWYGMIGELAGSRGQTRFSLSSTRGCAIYRPGASWATWTWPDGEVTVTDEFILCWGADGVESFGAAGGFERVAVRDDAICATEHSGKTGYCWGEHRAAFEEVPQVVDAGDATAAINTGLHAFRYPDNTGNTCATCHAPDGIDLSYLKWAPGNLKRRTSGHVPDDNVAKVLGLLEGNRVRYDWDPDIDGADYRPFQPEGEPLEGDTDTERDAAFATGLVERNLAIAGGPIETVEQAREARDELLALDLMNLPVGVALPKYSQDSFRGAEEKTMIEWVPAMGHRPANGKRGVLRALENSYLADPTDGNFISLLMAYNNTTDPVLVANPTFCGDMRRVDRCQEPQESIKIAGNMDGFERQRIMALMVLQHEMRREMMGEENRTTAEMSATYPLNPFWNWGAMAESSGSGCQAAREGLLWWQATDDTRRECMRIPEPWHNDYKFEKNCMNGERCPPSLDLIAMGLPLRWLGFMAQPALTPHSADKNDPEPSSLAKVASLGALLEASNLHTHHAFMEITHRMHKFFGPHQGWKVGQPLLSQEALVAEFKALPPLAAPAGTSEDHVKTHAQLVVNVQKMVALLADDVSL